MHTNQLKKVIVHPADFADLIGVEFHVDYAKKMAVLIHYRKSQQTVEDEELASVPYRRLCRKSNHPVHHDLGDWLIKRTEKKPAGRHDTLQPVVGIDDVEIDDAPSRGLPPHFFQRFTHGLIDM